MRINATVLTPRAVCVCLQDCNPGLVGLQSPVFHPWQLPALAAEGRNCNLSANSKTSQEYFLNLQQFVVQELYEPGIATLQ